jgi:hypothetical protein
MDWTEIPEFAHIDLSESYVLGWSISPGSIEFDLEVVLCEGHSQFHQPPSTDWACYHPGRLVFQGVHSLTGLPSQTEVQPATDASGAIDFGHLDALTQSGNRYEIAGDFGLASFSASGLKLVLAAP